MTCIVGIRGKGWVMMGCDSDGIGGDHRAPRADHKCFSRNGILFGFTSSYRMGQIIRYAEGFPFRKAGEVTERALVCKFVPWLRQTLEDQWFRNVSAEDFKGGQFVVGVPGKLFHVEGYFLSGLSIRSARSRRRGYNVAFGALFANKTMIQSHPEFCIRTALAAASQFNAYIGGPTRIYSEGDIP